MRALEASTKETHQQNDAIARLEWGWRRVKPTRV